MSRLLIKSNESFVHDVHHSQTVSDLRILLSEKDHLPLSEIKLYYGNNLLKDEVLLSSMVNMSTIDVVVPNSGGKVHGSHTQIIKKAMVNCAEENRNCDNHDKDFFCELCKISLVGQSFGTKETGFYCPDCYEINILDRCHGCSKPFKSGMKKIEKFSKFWHEECYVCFHCKQSIMSKKIYHNDGHVFCTPCYDEKYARRCKKCKEVIRKDGVMYRNEPWHKECHLCTKCNKQLANTKFTSKDDRPYCAKCFTDSFSKRCKKCKKPISGEGGCKFVTLEDDHWHSECFKCEKCDMILVGMGYVRRNLLILCPRCGLLNPNRP